MDPSKLQKLENPNSPSPNPDVPNPNSTNSNPYLNVPYPNPSNFNPNPNNPNHSFNHPNLNPSAPEHSYNHPNPSTNYPNVNPNFNNPYNVPCAGTSSPGKGNNHNPYVQMTPVSDKGSMDTVKKLLGQCGKKLEESTKKANESAVNVWQHLKTSNSVCDAAMARIAHGTKVVAEGGFEKIFHQMFGKTEGEKLKKSFACYISTSSGPVIGTLYVSNRRLAFCSDNPLCHYSAQGQQEQAYYKVIVQLGQLRAVNPSANMTNASERYIQIVTADTHEFWFMGFVSYDKALKTLIELPQHLHV